MSGTGFAITLLALSLALAFLIIIDLRQRVFALQQKSWNSSSSAVTAAIEDLRTAIAQVSATNRREFGAIWKRLGVSTRRAAEEEVATPTKPDYSDERFEAMLELQNRSKQ